MIRRCYFFGHEDEVVTDWDAMRHGYACRYCGNWAPDSIQRGAPVAPMDFRIAVAGEQMFTGVHRALEASLPNALAAAEAFRAALDKFYSPLRQLDRDEAKNDATN